MEDDYLHQRLPHRLTNGQLITVTGDSDPGANVTNLPVTVIDSVTFKVFRLLAYQVSGTGGTGTSTASIVLSRLNNIVSGTTTTPHNLAVGNYVQVSSVSNTAIGGGIADAERVNGISTITTTTAHGLVAGVTVVIGGVTDSTFNGTVQVATAPSPLTFTYAQPAADSSSSSGNVFDIWNGTFPVTAVPTATTFQYSQVGPPDFATSSGTVQQFGQIAPGVHNVVYSFLTRSGYITRPSPPATFSFSGGSYAVIGNLAPGPPNVVARIVQFTGAGGANHFYIPVPVLSNGMKIGTSTVVNDNTSVNAAFDFSDNALFNATATDIPGADLFALVVLAPCLNVKTYASRLFWIGEFNKVQNFLNMGFEGGFLTANQPLGWTLSDSQGALVSSPVDFGYAWQITGTGVGNAVGMISQPAYQDYLFDPILLPLQTYNLTFWAQAQTVGQLGAVYCDFFSPSQGILASGSINASNIPTAGAFVTITLNNATPSVIPPDTLIRVYAKLSAGEHVTIDELMTVYADNPYRNNLMRVSYANDWESYDESSGEIGPTDDNSQILDGGIIRQSFVMVTAEGAHITEDTATGEPDTWAVRLVDSKAGGVSSRCVVTGGYWLAWVSQNDTDLSMVIMDGGSTYRISQEIQPDFSGINKAAMSTIWAVIDTGGSSKRIYIGVPTGTNTTPNVIYPMDYRELDSSSDIATHGSLHISFTGKMLTTDLSRKWTRWNLPMNCGAIMNRTVNAKQFCVGSGGGGFGNMYYFDPLKLTDDDYGQMFPEYTGYFFVNHEAETQLPVGAWQKFYDWSKVYITGVGYLQVTPYVDSLSNPQKALVPLDADGNPQIKLKASIKRDIPVRAEINGDRVAFKISVSPLPNTTDVQFNLTHQVTRMRMHRVSALAELVDNG